MIHPTMFRFSLRQIMASRKFLFAALVSSTALLAGIGMLIGDAVAEAKTPGSFSDESESWIAIAGIGITIPLMCLILAGGFVADEVEDRTLTYILVRPIKRAHWYISKALAVMLIAGALAAAQVIAFMLMRFISLAIYGRGAMYEVYGAPDIALAPVMWKVLGISILAAPLMAFALCGFFGFVSLITPRFHFIANVLAFLTWDTLFGALGAKGPGFFTTTFHARSMVESVLPVRDFYNQGNVVAPVSVLALLAFTGFWLWIGAKTVQKRDFPITSAAS